MITRQGRANNPQHTDSWSSVKIHQMLIQDRLRNIAYNKAIARNVKSGDIVLDLGCGTGILSFFAAMRKCKKVYAVDKSNIIDCAVEIAKHNKLEKRIEFIKKDILKFKPEEKLDVLIHEQIGGFLWDEDLISKVAFVRDNFLKTSGIIIPSRIDLCLAPIHYNSSLEKSFSFFSRKHYGIDFKYLKKIIFIQNMINIPRPSVINLENTETFLCKEKLAYTVDLRRETQIPEKIAVSFELKKNSVLTGICGYYKVYTGKEQMFSTRPRKLSTSWAQFFLPCAEKKIIRKNSTLNFTLFPKKKPGEWKFKFDII